MENRNTENNTIFKDNNLEELIVYHASSSQDEIRFYLDDDTTYITAIEKCEGNILIKKMEEEKEEENKVSILTMFKNKAVFKGLIKSLFILIPIDVVLVTILFTINECIDSAFIVLFNISIFLSMFEIITSIVNALTISHSLKSKHSAEHMMVNFLEENKRLPKNMQEIRKSSRFSSDCGSRFLTEESVRELISEILASSAIILVVPNILHIGLLEITIVQFIIILVIYNITSSLIDLFLIDTLGFIVNPIERVLSHIVQCVCTTKKVKDSDIILAYCVARIWIQAVYPEFYKKDDDVFMNNYSNIQVNKSL